MLGIPYVGVDLIASSTDNPMTYTYHVFFKVNSLRPGPFISGVFACDCHNGRLRRGAKKEEGFLG